MLDAGSVNGRHRRVKTVRLLSRIRHPASGIILMASSTNSPAATAYAKSLLDLANGQSVAWEVASDLTGIRSALDADPSLEQFFANPSVSPTAREPLLAKAFEGRVQPLVWNFVRLVNQKGRLGLLRQIEATYKTLIDEQFGKIEVEVTTAQPLDEAALEEVRRAVGESLKRDATVKPKVDESIIGGLIVRVQDKLIDASVRAQLAALKQQMLAARPKAAAV
jgi:F-type H+-transporting ATPase subunit delta